MYHMKSIANLYTLEWWRHLMVAWFSDVSANLASSIFRERWRQLGSLEHRYTSPSQNGVITLKWKIELSTKLIIFVFWDLFVVSILSTRHFKSRSSGFWQRGSCWPPWRWRPHGPLETLVSYHNTTRRHKPEGLHLNCHRRVNLKSY